MARQSVIAARRPVCTRTRSRSAGDTKSAMRTRTSGPSRCTSTRARVDVQREGPEVRVRIADFVSPALLERVRVQTGRLAAITDWRAMVDSVSIDADYD